MKYLIDTGNIKAIEYINEFYPVAGVTTNPTLIAKEKDVFWRLIENIRSIIGDDKMLHVQTVQTEASMMIKEAKLINEQIGGALYIKIPICEEGIKAAMELKKLGIGVTMTAIFTPQQALMAAKANVDFVAPYINRLDNIVGDGVGLVEDIARLFKNYSLDCKILAASFKNVEQIQKCALAGCHAATIAPELFKTTISHPMTDAAIEGFTNDWKAFYNNRTILDF